jgi:hypothetical protein
MEDSAVRYLDMGRRVAEFTRAYAASFPAGSHASTLIAKIVAAVELMETMGAKQENAERNGRDATDRKEAKKASLLGLMRPVNRTARGMKKLFPDIGNQFAMPRTYSDQSVINVARSYITSAPPLIAEFTKRGLAANFPDALAAGVTAVESAIDAQAEALGEQTAATAGVAAGQKQLTDALHEFDPLVRNTLGNDPQALAAWKSASHVERAPKKAAKKKSSS